MSDGFDDGSDSRVRATAFWIVHDALAANATSSADATSKAVGMAAREDFEEPVEREQGHADDQRHIGDPRNLVPRRPADAAVADVLYGQERPVEVALARGDDGPARGDDDGPEGQRQPPPRRRVPPRHVRSRSEAAEHPRMPDDVERPVI